MSNRVKIKHKIDTPCCGNCKNRINGCCVFTNNKVWKYDKPCPKYIYKNGISNVYNKVIKLVHEYFRKRR